MKKKDTYLFPAVFTYEDGQISITFPDLPGCVSCADTDEEAMKNAQEAMGGHLFYMEQDGDAIPKATPLRDVVLCENERAVLVEVFMPAVRMAKETRAVNRTVTIPAWLNAAALARGVNFSQVLQTALMEQFGITRPQ